MGLRRPEKFDEVRGQGKTVDYIVERINQGTFPQFVLLTGEEGIGKTTIAKLIALALNCKSHHKPCYECSNCVAITENVIRNNKNTESVKSFRMSLDRGMEVAKEVVATFNSIIRPDQVRVIICDEGHGMYPEAQNALLQDTEYIPKDTYLIFITSEILGIKNQLTSRAVELKLKRLPKKDLVDLLRLEAGRRHLNIQGGDTTLELIASYADNKARKALKVIEAMGESNQISLDIIKDFIDFLDVRVMIPIISNLSDNGSIIAGMNTIMDMTVDQSSFRSIIEILQEALKFSLKQKSFKLTNEDNALLIDAVEDVPAERLAKFLYEVAAMRNNFTKQGLLAAWLKHHPMVSNISTPNSDVLNQELQTKYSHVAEDIPHVQKSAPPSLDELIRKGTQLGG